MAEVETETNSVSDSEQKKRLLSLFNDGSLATWAAEKQAVNAGQLSDEDRTQKGLDDFISGYPQGGLEGHLVYIFYRAGEIGKDPNNDASLKAKFELSSERYPDLPESQYYRAAILDGQNLKTQALVGFEMALKKWEGQLQKGAPFDQTLGERIETQIARVKNDLAGPN